MFIFPKKPYWCLSFILSIFLMAPAQAGIELRVAIKKQIPSLPVGSSTTAIVKDASGRQLGEITPMNGFLATTTENNVSLEKWQSSVITIQPQENGYIWIGDRWYRGDVVLIFQDNGITAINYIDIEEYLYSVVGAEAIPSWPLEALKAQAVAARSYALYKSSQTNNLIYDLDNTTATQVYKGLDSEYPSTHQAVDATQGEVMTYNGQVILAVFHSSSGGHTENVEDIWSSSLPYLRGVVDYDQQAPVYQWAKIFSPNEIGQFIEDVGNIQAMIPVKTTPQGRIISMTVQGDRASKELSGKQLRELLKLPSTLFVVSVDENGNFLVSGRGFGHGLGLSQWGAYYLAKQGINYLEILAHYYPHAILTKIDELNKLNNP